MTLAPIVLGSPIRQTIARGGSQSTESRDRSFEQCPQVDDPCGRLTPPYRKCLALTWAAALNFSSGQTIKARKDHLSALPSAVAMQTRPVAPPSAMWHALGLLAGSNVFTSTVRGSLPRKPRAPRITSGSVAPKRHSHAPAYVGCVDEGGGTPRADALPFCVLGSAC